MSLKTIEDPKTIGPSLVDPPAEPGPVTPPPAAELPGYPAPEAGAAASAAPPVEAPTLAAPPALPKPRKPLPAKPHKPVKILRFARSERIVHWAIAGPFLLSMATAMVLVFIYNPNPARPFRHVFATIHRVSGVALMVLPMVAAFKSRGDARLHLYNIKVAWTWMFDDFKWLALMGLAAMNSRIRLPEQGKFNAAEKINFMVLMVTYPLYVLTGLLMWLTPLAIFSWLLHFFMATMAVPLIGGHFFMAVINPASRKGLEGMISGYVDRQWAKHHYTRWYREHHGHTDTDPHSDHEHAV